MPEIKKTSANTLLFISNNDLPVTSDWFDSDFWQGQEITKEQSAGRGSVNFVENEQGQFAIRKYLRGGLISKYIHARFFFAGAKKTRPYQELDLLEYMQEQRLPAPEPIAGTCKKFGFAYEASIMTRIIPDAAELFQVILTANSKGNKWPKINWYVLGSTIRRFHDAGIDHADLNCHNIMLDMNNKIWLIDFDKCQRRNGKGWQQNNLARLKRSLDKEAELYEEFEYHHSDWQTLLEGYHG